MVADKAQQRSERSAARLRPSCGVSRAQRLDRDTPGSGEIAADSSAARCGGALPPERRPDRSGLEDGNHDLVVGAESLVERKAALAHDEQVVSTLERGRSLSPLWPADHPETPLEDLEIALREPGEQLHLLEVQAVRRIGEAKGDRAVR